MHSLLQRQFTRPQELGFAGFLSMVMVLLVFMVMRVAPEHTPMASSEEQEFDPIAVFPDFDSIMDVSVKKQQFFDYIQDYVDAENNEILSLRKRLLPLARIAEESKTFSEREQNFVDEVANDYDVDVDTLSAEEVMEELVERVDVIPPSLVLAQAANESAWGTSRFAVDANNVFGQWCFIEGCGVVPRRRVQGATHEVKRFESVEDAVAGYFMNLNTHQPYSYMRELRSHMREESQPIDSMVLAFGLGRYSERGDHYVDEVQNIIIQNDLHLRDDQL